MKDHETPWYMQYHSSGGLSQEDKHFLSRYTEDEVGDFMFKHYPNIINADKLSIKDAVDFMRYCLEEPSSGDLYNEEKDLTVYEWTSKNQISNWDRFIRWKNIWKSLEQARKDWGIKRKLPKRIALKEMTKYLVESDREDM